VIDQVGRIIEDRAVFIAAFAKREAVPPVAAAEIKDPMPGTDRDKLTYHVNLPARKLVVSNRVGVRQEVTSSKMVFHHSGSTLMAMMAPHELQNQKARPRQ
jgi:hypothetical protein